MFGRVLVAVALVGTGLGCSGAAAPTAQTVNPSSAPTAPSVSTVPESPAFEHLRVEVIGTAPHDRTTFTQGLELHDGRFLESSGLYGVSWLRWIDADTGATLVEHTLPADVFAEGATVVGDRVVQLSYRNERAFVYDAETLQPMGEFTYSGEGWGLCAMGSNPGDQTLVMSNGSATLTLRDPSTFAVIGAVEVHDPNGPVENLNELECVNGEVYANVWRTERIVRIDLASGAVTADIDASGLLSAEEGVGVDVLNGIAYAADSRSFWLTGKYWPLRIHARFVPVGGER